MTDYPFVLTQRRLIAANTTELILAPATTFDFTFTPGQYIELVFPHQPYQDESGNHRSFSLAAAPRLDNQLTIAFRHSPSAFKKSLLGAPLGTSLTVQGPFGVFTRLPAMEPAAFIAGGIGITPFRAILEADPRGYLLYANRAHENAAYLDELTAKVKTGQFDLINHYGPIDISVIENLVNRSRATTYFVAGPLLMTNVAMELLMNQGVPRSRILIEQFTGYE